MNAIINGWAGVSDLLKFDNWPQLLVNRFLFRSQPLVVYRYRGMEVLIDHEGGDQSGTRACLVTDMYSRYFSFLPQDRSLNLLDLGCNGGGLPLSLQAAGVRLNTVACVEMNPATYMRMHFNISRNVHAAQKHLINAAAYHSDGYIEVSLGKGCTNDSIHGKGNTGELSQSIPTRSFDTLMDTCFPQQRVDLCKIDIEGAEYELLLGGNNRRLTDVKFLLIEIHPHSVHQSHEVLTKLSDIGFKEICREQTTSSDCSVHLLER